MVSGASIYVPISLAAAPSRDHNRAFHERVTHTASSRVTPKRVDAHTHTWSQNRGSPMSVFRKWPVDTYLVKTVAQLIKPRLCPSGHPTDDPPEGQVSSWVGDDQRTPGVVCFFFLFFCLLPVEVVVLWWVCFVWEQWLDFSMSPGAWPEPSRGANACMMQGFHMNHGAYI